MRTFPHSDCPTAGALLAYAEGRADAALRASIEAHLQACGACRTALAALRESIGATEDVRHAEANQSSDRRFEPFGQPKHVEEPTGSYETTGGTPDAAAFLRTSFSRFLAQHRPDVLSRVEDRLAEQRAVIGRMLTEQCPPLEFGQVWAVQPWQHLRVTSGDVARGKVPRRDDWPYPDGAGLSFLVLVLSHHTSAVDNAALVNVAPVTDDERLATEWSLIFDGEHSGIGGSAVIHIDFEQSARVECLHRYIGRLPEKAGEDLLAVAHAWSRSEPSPYSLSVGRMGQAAVRTRPDWQALDEWLSGTMQRLCDFAWEDDFQQEGMADAAGAVQGDAPYIRLDSVERRDVGVTAPTGATSNSPSSAPSRPTVPVPERRPTTRAFDSYPELHHAAGHDPVAPAGRWNRANAVPPSQGLGALDMSFLDAVRQLLATKHSGSLAAWSRLHGCALEWDDVAPWHAFSVEDLIQPNWRPAFINVSGPRTPRLQALLILATDVRFHVTQQRDLLRGQSVTQRAARHQTPPKRRPGDGPSGSQSKPSSS